MKRDLFLFLFNGILHIYTRRMVLKSVLLMFVVIALN